MDDSSWQTACEVGQFTALKALKSKMQRRAKRGGDVESMMALLVGALTATAAAIGQNAMPGAKTELAEEIALAYVRGAIRGGVAPVNADGSEFIRLNTPVFR